MNILFISNKSETGGAPKSLQGILSCLKDTNSITVVTPKKGLIYDFCKKNHINVIRTYHDSFLIFSGNSKFKKNIRKMLILFLKIKHYILNKISISIIKKSININDIDIIHTNFYRDDIGGIISKEFHKPHIVHLREFGDLDYDCLSLVKDKIKYLDSYTTNFIAISDSVKEHYMKLGIDNKKIVRIYNGVNTSKIHKHYNRYDSKIKMVLVGNISDAKGQLDVLKAILLINEKNRKRFYIDFYGRADEKYLKKIKKFIDENDLNNNVKIYEYVDNIYSILKDYDVGLMCSKSEAFGRVTIEYMAAGLLTIASSTGANTEIIDNNVDGFIYDKENLNTLANILNSIISNNYDDIRKRAIKKAETNYTDYKNAINIYRLYLDCIK